MEDIVQFRPGKLIDRLESRKWESGSSFGLVAKRDLDRYYDVLWESQPRFSNNEMLAIIWTLLAATGRGIDRGTYRHVWAEIESGYERLKGDELGEISGPVDIEESYDVSISSLSQRVKELSFAETVSLIDLAERVWQDWRAGEDPEVLSLERHYRWYKPNSNIA